MSSIDGKYLLCVAIRRVSFQTRSDEEIRISMDGRGRVFDNIFVERLWRTVKYEDIYLKEYENVPSLIRGLGIYFDFSLFLSSLRQISDTVHAYPTMAEIVRKMGDQYQRTRLSPSARKLFAWLYRRSRR